jgi:hypothetical protein
MTTDGQRDMKLIIAFRSFARRLKIHFVVSGNVSIRNIITCQTIVLYDFKIRCFHVKHLSVVFTTVW